jgi:hypothetical protein
VNEFNRCLVELDVAAIRRLWAATSPGAHQPQSDLEALIALHHARTQAESVPFNLRAYSHRWLCERDLPSGLPDELKPRAERVYPKIVEAVGVSVKAMSEASIPLAKAIERAMSDAVEEAYADGNRNSDFVKARMQEARARVLRG